jgi:predicted amidohydrolase
LTIVRYAIKKEQKVRIYADESSFQERINTFAGQAKKENCGLIVFPEGVGAMLVSQYLPKPLVKVLMTAYNDEEGASQVKAAGKLLLGRVLDKVTQSQDLAATFNETVAKHGEELFSSYLRVFGDTAKRHNMYVVGGSIYAPRKQDGKIVNAAYLFGPDGEVVGCQEKIHLYVEDRHLCVPGETINVFDTDFGKIGLPICYEGMFPEIARIMVLKGARALLNVSACPGETCFLKIRAGAWSRVQDNQVFGVHSCLVGKNDLSKQFKEPYRGRSSILAPLEYTADRSGVMAEAESLDDEDFLSAEWDFNMLEEITANCDTQVLKDMDTVVIKKYYADL